MTDQYSTQIEPSPRHLRPDLARDRRWHPLQSSAMPLPAGGGGGAHPQAARRLGSQWLCQSSPRSGAVAAVPGQGVEKS